MSEHTEGFQQWVVLEIMGHKRLAGFLTEQEIGGGSFLRLDIPSSDGKAKWKATQYYNPQSIYCITPTDETTARACAANWTQAPVTQWELREMLPVHEREEEIDGEQDNLDF